MGKQVAVIIPCYNSERFIPPLMESFLNQTYKDIELIMVNDVSADKTYDVIESFRDKLASVGIGLIHIEQGNEGMSEAINTGLKQVDSEFVMWMDVDDYLMPNAIEVKRQFLIDHPECDFAFCRGYIVNESDMDTPISVVERKRDGEDNLFEDLLFEHGAFFSGIGYITRTSSLWKAIPTRHICGNREGQNWQLLLPLSYSRKYGYIDDFLFKYVVHDDSHSHVRRTYEQQMARRCNYLLITQETLKAIPDMSADDKERWLQIAAKHHMYKKMLLAEAYYKYKDYRKFLRALRKSDVKVPFKDRYFVHFCCHAIGYIKRKVLRRK